MEIDNFNSILFSDTLIPDIFINEYLPELSSNSVKLYIYMNYLAKQKKQMDDKHELSSLLNLSKEEFKNSIDELLIKNLIRKKSKKYSIMDIKKIELNKKYKAIENATADELIADSTKNKQRNKVLEAINNMFFNGLMSPDWYTRIRKMFEQYNFDDDVMIQLFQQCYSNGSLSKNYVEQVAKSWHNSEIVNSFDLDRYMQKRDTVYNIARLISKRLKFMRMLSEYEIEYIEKWLYEYNYDKEIIEFALTKTTSATKPTMKYLDSIISNWHKNGYETITQVKTGDKARSKKRNISKKTSFEQRNFNEKEIEDLYYNPSKKR